MSEKRPRIARPQSKREPLYWRQRLFKNAYTYQGKRGEVRSWSVKIQLLGRRKAFTLRSQDPVQAAGEACHIYRSIIERGWDAVIASRAQTGLGSLAAAGSVSPASIRYDTEDWKRRLIHRRYPETSPSRSDREFSVRIEHARTSQYFPLGTSDENTAAAQAVRIYQTVVNQGWASANATFPREFSVALRWQENPLAWTYTTIHTRQQGSPLKPLPGQAGPLREKTVAFIEPDAGIRFALAACANHQAGFRCDAAFAGAAEARREIPARRVDLAFANHELAEGLGGADLEELQRLWPSLTLLSYSVFEDSDQLFKSTPGGAAFYLLERTSPTRIFEPIAELAGPATREQIAAHVRKHFQHLPALLPSGPPFWKLAKLTPREHEILASLSKGYLVKEIADTLGISNWTVQGHVKSIFAKLKVHTRTEAVIKYLQK